MLDVDNITVAIISGLISFFLGAAASEFVFKIFYARWLDRKESERKIREMSFPLLRSADALDKRIEILLKNALSGRVDNDPDFLLNNYYLFANFFGLCKIIENQGFFEYMTDEKARAFSINLYNVYKGLNSFSYFEKVEDKNNFSIEKIESTTIPKLASNAIGEFMVIKENDGRYRTLSFIEFIEKYQNNDEFKKWIDYLDNLIRDLNYDKLNTQWNRIVIVAINIRKLVTYLDEKSSKTSPRRIYHYNKLHDEIAPIITEDLEKSGYKIISSKEGTYYQINPPYPFIRD